LFTSTKAGHATVSVVPLTIVATFDSPCCLEVDEGAGDFNAFFFGGGDLVFLDFFFFFGGADFVNLDFLYPTFLNPTLQI
jgi:hypothetical protein